MDSRKHIKSGAHYFQHKKSSGNDSQSRTISVDNDLSRLSIFQAERDHHNSPYCPDLWSDMLLPRVQAKPFGVPNLRTILLVQRQQAGRVELLTEVSKTDNGKFFIVVFQRYINLKKSARDIAPQPEKSFNDIKVKEMWQVEAIQLLKRFNNDLSTFIGQVVVFNPRYERVEFNNLHKYLLEMGQLSSR